MALWTQEHELVDCCEVDEHKYKLEDELIDNKILNSFVLLQKPSGSLIENCVTRSEMEKLMGVNIKNAVQVATRRSVTEIVEEAIENVSTIGYNEEKEEI